MGHASPTLWLTPAPSSSGCGACLTSDDVPSCRAHVNAETCAHPRLAGQRDQLQQVMQELDRHVVDPDTGRGIVDLQWVKALHIGNGEAELTLGFAPKCGPGKELADAAFQTLRRLLPDTDIFVSHDA